jgi:hypothetical protein
VDAPEPIRQAFVVEADQRRTFKTFACTLSAWWPMEARSPRGQPADVRIEECRGGRIYRVDQGGREHEWGHVTLWDPPQAFSFVSETLPGPERTEVALRFQRLGPALTRVVVEHRGWERLSSALYDRHTSHVGGWLAALRRYAAIFETDAAADGRRRPATDATPPD